MLKLDTLKLDNYTIIDIIGRLDTSTYGQLEEKIAEILDAGETNVVVNLEMMEYVSSSGLRIFLMMLKRIKTLNGKFYLCNLRQSVKEIFEIAGFTSIFQIFNTKEDALNNL